jgi:hypothetical protein
MKRLLAAMTAASAVLLGGVVTAQPAAADVPCTVTSYTPRTIEVGLSKVTKTVKVGTSGCATVDRWSMYVDGTPDYGYVGLAYVRSSAPSLSFWPGYLYNADAGFRWNVEVDVHNGDGVSTVRTFGDSFVVKRRVAISRFEAGPDPVAKGRPIALKGLLRSADWDRGRYVPLRYASVRVQYKSGFNDTWSTVKTVKSSSTGWVNTTVTATADGYWRLYYPGGTRFGARGVYPQHIDVR